jgi:hypothetical protein
VAFEDAGWVVFRPTPDRDRVLPDELPEPTPRPQPVAQPPPPPPPQVEQQPETKQQDVDDDQDKADEAFALPAWVGRVALGVGIPLLLVGLYAGVVLGLKARRRARRRGRPRPADRVSGGWDELTDLAADLGRPASPLATRRENAAALGGGSVAMLAREADAATFGPREVDDAEAADFWALVESTSSEMRAPLTRRQRMRARLGLRSLRSRRSRRGGV